MLIEPVKYEPVDLSVILFIQYFMSVIFEQMHLHLQDPGLFIRLIRSLHTGTVISDRILTA